MLHSRLKKEAKAFVSSAEKKEGEGGEEKLRKGGRGGRSRNVELKR